MDTAAYLGQPFSRPRGSRVRTQQVVLQGQPVAAGAPFVLVMDSTYAWRPLACIFTLQTSGAAANRYVTVEYQRVAGPTWCVNAAAVLSTAGEVDRYVGSATRGAAEWNTGTDVLFPLEPLWLAGGDQLAVEVANMDAADQLSGLVFVFDRVQPDIGEVESVPIRGSRSEGAGGATSGGGGGG